MSGIAFISYYIICIYEYVCVLCVNVLALGKHVWPPLTFLWFLTACQNVTLTCYKKKRNRKNAALSLPGLRESI